MLCGACFFLQKVVVFLDCKESLPGSWYLDSSGVRFCMFTCWLVTVIAVKLTTLLTVSVSQTKTQWALSGIISRGSVTGVRNCQTSCTIPYLQFINKTTLTLLCFCFFYHINKVIETIGIS